MYVFFFVEMKFVMKMLNVLKKEIIQSEYLHSLANISTSVIST